MEAEARLWEAPETLHFTVGVWGLRMGWGGVEGGRQQEGSSGFVMWWKELRIFMSLFESWLHNFSKAVEVLFLFLPREGGGERKGDQGGDKISFFIHFRV